MPCFRKLVPDIEETYACIRQILLCAFVSSLAQILSTLASREVQVQNQVTERLHVEMVVLKGKFYTPAADGPRKLKRQIAFIAEIEFKHSGIVLSARGCDGFGGSVHGNYAAVVGQRLIAVLAALILTA